MEKYYKSYDIAGTGQNKRAGKLLIFMLCLITILLLVSSIKGHASLLYEKITITGKIIDASTSEPLPGVNILAKGTTDGTVTDLNGEFILEVDPDAVIVISYVGYTSEEITLKGETYIEVKLYEDIMELDECVVTGYGSVRKSDMTGSVSTISSSRSYRGRARGISSGKSSSSASAVKTSSGADYTSSYSALPVLKGGKLTVGEVNDFSKWELWTDISEGTLGTYAGIWQVKPKERYTYQLKNENGFPVIDAEVKLLDEFGNVVWKARTDNSGRAELWNAFFNEKTMESGSMSIEVNAAGFTKKFYDATMFHDGINFQTAGNICQMNDIADIAFVVDATGSMGDEIEYLKAELNDVISKVKEQNEDLTIRLGSVFYRDMGDEYVTRKSDLSDDITQTINFMNEQYAGGGGDFPEAVDAALNVAVNELNWTEKARTRIIFLILDAPPHQDSQAVKKIQQSIKQAAEKGIRIVPLTCSGIDKSTEYLMRSLALGTNGTYVFLTDDSGIGGTHLKPTTDKYDVEKMNKSLLRIIYQFTETPSCLTDSVQVVENIADSTILDEIKYIINKNQLEEKAKDTVVQETQKSKEELKFDKLIMYPNPTSGIIHFNNDLPGGELYLVDMSGKLLNRYVVQSETETEIDITDYPTGIYFIKYIKGTESVTGKIILTH